MVLITPGAYVINIMGAAAVQGETNESKQKIHIVRFGQIKKNVLNFKFWLWKNRQVRKLAVYAGNFTDGECESLTGDNLEVVLAEFSTLSSAVFLFWKKCMVPMHTHILNWKLGPGFVLLA